MPKEMEMALMKEAAKKGLKGKRKNAYIWGTMNKTGMMKKKKKSHISVSDMRKAAKLMMRGK